MQTLKDQLRKLEDLKRQREIAAFRYYSNDVSVTIIELIINEIENWPSTERIPEDIYIFLANSESLNRSSISDLCEIYRKVILISVKNDNL
jgi:hypothetical protein